MSKFVIKNIPEIRGRQVFRQIVILPDEADLSRININEETGVWDDYQDNIEQKYQGSLRGLAAIMERKANLLPLSKTQFRDITPQKESVAEYEFKYQDLRAYGIKIPNAVLLLLGGYKNSQQDDITAFRALKKRYLDSLK